MVAIIVSLIGAFLGFLGSLLIVLALPIDILDYFGKLDSEVNAPKKRIMVKRTRTGIVLLVCGFVVQMLAATLSLCSFL